MFFKNVIENSFWKYKICSYYLNLVFFFLFFLVFQNIKNWKLNMFSMFFL